jgi:hypothetical protein
LDLSGYCRGWQSSRGDKIFDGTARGDYDDDGQANDHPSVHVSIISNTCCKSTDFQVHCQRPYGIYGEMASQRSVAAQSRDRNPLGPHYYFVQRAKMPVEMRRLLRWARQSWPDSVFPSLSPIASSSRFWMANSEVLVA